MNSNSGNNHSNSETHNSNNNDESCHFDEDASYSGFKHQSRMKSSKSDAVSLQVKSLSNYLFNFGYYLFKRSNHGRRSSTTIDFHQRVSEVECYTFLILTYVIYIILVHRVKLQKNVVATGTGIVPIICIATK